MSHYSQNAAPVLHTPMMMMMCPQRCGDGDGEGVGALLRKSVKLSECCEYENMTRDQCKLCQNVGSIAKLLQAAQHSCMHTE